MRDPRCSRAYCPLRLPLSDAPIHKLLLPCPMPMSDASTARTNLLSLTRSFCSHFCPSHHTLLYASSCSHLLRGPLMPDAPMLLSLLFNRKLSYSSYCSNILRDPPICPNVRCSHVNCPDFQLYIGPAAPIFTHCNAYSHIAAPILRVGLARFSTIYEICLCASSGIFLN